MKVGDKVICVKSAKTLGGYEIFKETRYTISWVGTFLGNKAVKVEEKGICVWRYDRFKKIDYDLDYNFVENIIKEIYPKKQRLNK